jgi:leucine-rich repeat protein SHOC2
MSAKTVELAQLIDRIAPNSTVLDLRGYGLETLPENIGDLTYLTKLNLNGNRLTSLPESIGNLTNLTELYLNGHKLTTLPESIGNLTNLTRLYLNGDRLDSLPDSITNLTQLTKLKLSSNKFECIPDIVLKIPNIQKINLDDNLLTDLSNLKCISRLEIYRTNKRAKFKIFKLKNSVRIVIGDRYLESILAHLSNLTNIVFLGIWSEYGSHSICTDEDKAKSYLQGMIDYFLSSFLQQNTKLLEFNWNLMHYPRSLRSEGISGSYSESGLYFKRWTDSDSELNFLGNLLENLPQSIIGWKRLTCIRLDFNPLSDLSILKSLPNLTHVDFLGAKLSRRYWTKLSEWKPEWLLDENNAEIRRRIIEQVGYEEICNLLNAKEVNTWREYLLLKIDNFEPILEQGRKPIGKEPIALLRMTCPSTGHVHILRVPPDMTSAEEAIVWVNHGIHPDRFTIQT